MNVSEWYIMSVDLHAYMVQYYGVQKDIIEP